MIDPLVVPLPPVRLTGNPPRCRGCGRLCRQAQPGPALDRVCAACHSTNAASARCLGPARLLNWYLRGATTR